MKDYFAILFIWICFLASASLGLFMVFQGFLVLHFWMLPVLGLVLIPPCIINRYY